MSSEADMQRSIAAWNLITAAQAVLSTQQGVLDVEAGNPINDDTLIFGLRGLHALLAYSDRYVEFAPLLSAIRSAMDFISITAEARDLARSTAERCEALMRAHDWGFPSPKAERVG